MNDTENDRSVAKLLKKGISALMLSGETEPMRNTFAAAVISCFGLVGCSYIDAITGAPKKMNNAEAAVRYLEIVCPANINNAAFNKETTRLEDLYAADKITEEQLAEKRDILLAKFAEGTLGDSEEFTDPSYIWPNPVRELVAEMSAAKLEAASATREFLKLGGYKEIVSKQREWPEPPYKAHSTAGEKASAIRSALRLPPRNEGCKDGKPALTVDQMRERQEG